MLGLSTLQLTLVGAALAAMGTVAGVVLITSGPLADDGGKSPSAQFATQMPDSRPLMAATNAATTDSQTTPSSTPSLELDVQGWPVVDCTAGYELAAAVYRRLVACKPVGWTDHTSNYTGVPAGFFATNLIFREPATGERQPGVIAIGIIEKRSGDEAGLFAGVHACVRPEDVWLAGHAGRMCVAKASEADGNGMGTAYHTWMMRAYAGAGDRAWIKFEAAGFETEGTAIEAAIERARVVLATARLNGTDAFDADGWPVVECGGGLEPTRSPTRRITMCAPAEGFVFTPYERDEPGDRLQHLLWTHGEMFDYFISLQVVSREGSPWTTDDYRADCETDEPTGTATVTGIVLLGYPGTQCLLRGADPTKPVIGNQPWGVQQFVELPDYWIIANATGPQVGNDADTALELALRMFASARVAGLDKLAAVGD